MTSKREWVVEEGVFDENEDKLREILGDRLILAKYTINGPTFSKSPVTDYIFYGTHTLGRRLQRSKDAKAICWLYDKVYDCNYYLPFFGGYALNNPHLFVEAGTFHLLRDSLSSPSMFVKQNSGYKTFTGLVVNSEIPTDLYRDELLMLAPVKPVELEWRFVISKGSVLTQSPYGDILDSGPHMEEAKEFAKAVITTDYDPAPMWTLDICRSEGAYKVVEVNSLLSAGWYNCDIAKIV
jgi:hypothetical protein